MRRVCRIPTIPQLVTSSSAEFYSVMSAPRFRLELVGSVNLECTSHESVCCEDHPTSDPAVPSPDLRKSHEEHQPQQIMSPQQSEVAGATPMVTTLAPQSMRDNLLATAPQASPHDTS